jgi:hypothetical protein
MRTNFADNARESLCTLGAAQSMSFFRNPRRRGGESESPEEEAIEIGNSYRNL